MPGILSQCLFHLCMKLILAPLRIDQRKYYMVPSPDGNSRLCMAVLMAWIADLEEQLLISGVQHLSCPVCTAVYHNLAETDGCGVRCRRDKGFLWGPPLYAGFCPQKLTVINRQEFH